MCLTHSNAFTQTHVHTCRTLLFPSHTVNQIFDHAGDIFVVGYMSIPKSGHKDKVGRAQTIVMLLLHDVSSPLWYDSV